MSNSTAGSFATVGEASVRKSLLGDEQTTAVGLGRDALEYVDAAIKLEHDDEGLGLKAVFEVQPGDTAALQTLIELTRKQSQRYIQTSYERWPTWSIVEPVAVCLRAAVAKRFGYRTFDMANPGL